MTSVFSSYSGGYGFNGFPSPLSPSFTGGNVTYGGRVPSQPTVSVGSHFGLQSQCASPVFSEASPYDASHFAYHPTSYDTHPQAAPSYPRDSTAGDIANFTAMTGVNPRMPSWDGASANTYTAPESVPDRPYWESPTTSTAPYPSTDLMPGESAYCVQVQRTPVAVSDITTGNPIFSPASYTSSGAGPWSPVSLLSPNGSSQGSLESRDASPLLQNFSTASGWEYPAPNNSAAPTSSAPDHHRGSPRLNDSFTHYDPGSPVPDTSVAPDSEYLGSPSAHSFQPAPSRCSRFSYGSTVPDDSPPTSTPYSYRGLDPSHKIPEPPPSLVTTPDWIKRMDRERDTGWGTRASSFVKDRMTETVRSLVSGLITQGVKHGIRPWGP